MNDIETRFALLEHTIGKLQRDLSEAQDDLAGLAAQIVAMQTVKKWTVERVPPPEMTAQERYDAVGRARELFRNARKECW